MNFTPLHRELGRQPGPVNDDMIDEAISKRPVETDDIHWKKALPPRKGMVDTDFCKDIAAMSNYGGGVIVYGVGEQDKMTVERVDVGDFDENYERAMRSACVTGIHPPIFGLGITLVGQGGSRAVVVTVPTSVDSPHLIYRGEYFGAPIRNNADTIWMRERQLEALYRTRFEERRVSHEALDTLYAEAAMGRLTTQRAWMVAVARPRIPAAGARISRDEARERLRAAEMLGKQFTRDGAPHPLPRADIDNPRPGLRRWVAVPRDGNIGTVKESWASIHHDGSVTIATSLGGSRLTFDEYANGWEVDSLNMEIFVADLMGLIRTASSGGEYEVRTGVEWEGEENLFIYTADDFGHPWTGSTVPLARYIAVETTVRSDADSAGFRRQLADLATDVINQGGISNLRALRPLNS